MDTSMIWKIAIINNLETFINFIVVVLTIIVVYFFIKKYIISFKPNINDDNKKVPKCKKVLKICTPILFLCVIISILIPSKTELYLLYLSGLDNKIEYKYQNPIKDTINVSDTSKQKIYNTILNKDFFKNNKNEKY